MRFLWHFRVDLPDPCQRWTPGEVKRRDLNEKWRGQAGERVVNWSFILLMQREMKLVSSLDSFSVGNNGSSTSVPRDPWCTCNNPRNNYVDAKHTFATSLVSYPRWILQFVMNFSFFQTSEFDDQTNCSRTPSACSVLTFSLVRFV